MLVCPSKSNRRNPWERNNSCRNIFVISNCLVKCHVQCLCQTSCPKLPCQIIKCLTEYTYHLLVVGMRIHCPFPACGWLRNSHKTNYTGLYQMHSQMFCPISISNTMSNSFHKVRSNCDVEIFTRCVMPINV